MKTYIAYLRQSTTKQQLRVLGIEAQREIIHGHIKNGASILHEFLKRRWARETIVRCCWRHLKLCRPHKSTLICAKLDWLSRNVAFTSRLLESDVAIVFCDFPQANRLVLHIISSIAEYEAGLISVRTRQALAAKKQRGAILGKPENLLDNLRQAILHSTATNSPKALDNENNQRAAAIISMMRAQNHDYVRIARLLNEQGF